MNDNLLNIDEHVALKVNLSAFKNMQRNNFIIQNDF